MVSRKGSLLESNLKQLLELAGFRSELHRILKGYEIDVYMEVESKKVAFECKQYEKSKLSIRNLIHEWESKNKELNLDRIVLVLFGAEPTESDYQLARKYGLIIWDENKFLLLLNTATKEKTKSRPIILRELNISHKTLLSPEFKAIQKTEIFTLVKELKELATKDGSHGEVGVNILLSGAEKVVNISYSGYFDYFSVSYPCEKYYRKSRSAIHWLFGLPKQEIREYENELVKKTDKIAQQIGLKQRPHPKLKYFEEKKQGVLGFSELNSMEWDVKECYASLYEKERSDNDKSSPVIHVIRLRFDGDPLKTATFLDTMIKDVFGLGNNYLFQIFKN